MAFGTDVDVHVDVHVDVIIDDGVGIFYISFLMLMMVSVLILM